MVHSAWAGMASRHSLQYGRRSRKFHLRVICSSTLRPFSFGEMLMKWKKSTATIHLEARDIAVMNQCGQGVAELINKKATREYLPPLWSILSYEMLRNTTESTNHFWKSYRQSRALAEERYNHYSPAYLQKNTSGTRTLNVPDWEIARHQHFMLREIFDHIPVSPCAFAYRKGHGIKECAAPHVKQQTLIHLDVKDFFSSITEATVFQAIEKETGYAKQLVDFMSKLCCHNGVLPQGACTSPVLSNICFRPCDDDLLSYASQHNLRYTRYSDDLFFSGEIDCIKDRIIELGAILNRHGFRVNKEKTKVLHQNSSQKIVGLVVNEKIQVSRDYRRALRQELYYLHKYREDSTGAQGEDLFLTYLYRLQGKVAFVLSIDPHNEEFRSERKKLLELIDEYENRFINDWLKSGCCGTYVRYLGKADRQNFGNEVIL